MTEGLRLAIAAIRLDIDQTFSLSTWRKRKGMWHAIEVLERELERELAEEDKA